jgi:hypothetical protein
VPILKTRTFLRIVEAGNLEPAIAAVDEEVNAFLATFADVTAVRGIDYHTGMASKYGERLLYKVTVVFLE